MIKRLSLFAALLICAAAPIRAHDHFAAGVIDLNGDHVGNQGEQLKLFNGTPTGLVFHLEARVTGQLYAGYHVLDDGSVDGFTFTSRFSSLNEQDHASLDANIVMEIRSVTGPAGGHFGFWESEDDYQTPRVLGPNFATPSDVFAANQPTGGFRFPVSEIIPGDPDPGGHIHYRAWTVDQPGTYTVTFKLYDISTAGAGGGPFQVASQDYVFQFLAVPEPGTAALLGSAALVLCGLRRRRIP